MKLTICCITTVILGSVVSRTDAAFTVTILGEGAAYDVSNGIQVGYHQGIDKYASYWSGSAASRVELDSGGSSRANGVSGTKQAGSFPGQGGWLHAVLWSGTAASAIDLHPSGFTGSVAEGVSGASQVGWAFDIDPHPGFTHAMLWYGSAASAIDLNPAGFTDSIAYDVSGSIQVGTGNPTSGGTHALLWSGSAASVVDLHPSGYTYSEAYGVSGGSQVGKGYHTATNRYHAVMWNGSAASVVDLHPSGFRESEAHDVSSIGQVGWGRFDVPGFNDPYHALLWTGTASSVVDLHPFLTAVDPSFTQSYAYGIDSLGNIVGYATGASGQMAVLWSPVVVPEPTSSTIFALGLFLLSSVRCRADR
jgi:hypothetical protein